MPEDPEQLYNILGVDRATRAANAQPGSCQAIQGVVPAGPKDKPYWTVPAQESRKANGAGGDLIDRVLSVGTQERKRLGPLADEGTASLRRLVLLKPDGIYVSDSCKRYSTTKVYDFRFSDTTRRATFVQVGESVIISVTSGSGVGDPEQMLELRGDEVIPFTWHKLPDFSVAFSSTSGTGLPGSETFVFRLAYILDDGSIGPASGPVEKTTGSTGPYSATVTIDEYFTAPPRAWEERVASLALIVHAPLYDDNNNLVTPAIHAPGHVVAEVQDLSPGTSLDWADDIEGILSEETYEGSGLRQHDMSAGAIYSYNKRLIAGDVDYDLEKPDLREIFDWEQGTSNDGGNDYWLTMVIRVKTVTGVIERIAQPIPYDESNAKSVATQYGMVWYRDSRAVSWSLYVSENYNGVISDATWNIPTDAPRKEFKTARGSTLSFYRTDDTTTFDLTSYEPTTRDLTDGDEWNEANDKASPLTVFERLYYEAGTEQIGDSPKESYINLNDEGYTANDDLTKVVFDVELFTATNEEVGSPEAEATARIRIYDDDGSGNPGSVLEDREKTTDGREKIEVTNITNNSDAAHLRIDLNATVDLGVINAPLQGTDFIASAAVQVREVSIETANAKLTASIPLTESVNQDTDRGPNRVIWSRTYRPYDRPVENLEYAGDSTTDAVFGFAASGRAASEGQYGDFPLLALQAGSIRMLSISPGGESFINAVTPITTQTGIVGREAYTNVQGQIAVATPEGVYLLSPQLQEPALSEPLHDPHTPFPQSMGADTALAYYTDRTRGRRELWVAADERTRVYSTRHGTWSSLDRRRIDFAKHGTLFGATKSGHLARENGDFSKSSTVTIVTKPLHFGQVGHLEQIKALFLERDIGFEEVNFELVAIDHDTTQVSIGEIERARLPDDSAAAQLLPNAGITRGTFKGSGTVDLPQNMAYSWFIRFTAQAQPDAALTGFGASVEPKEPARRADFTTTIPIQRSGSVITQEHECVSKYGVIAPPGTDPGDGDGGGDGNDPIDPIQSAQSNTQAHNWLRVQEQIRDITPGEGTLEADQDEPFDYDEDRSSTRDVSGTVEPDRSVQQITPIRLYDPPGRPIPDNYQGIVEGYFVNEEFSVTDLGWACPIEVDVPDPVSRTHTYNIHGHIHKSEFPDLKTGIRASYIEITSKEEDGGSRVYKGNSPLSLGKDFGGHIWVTIRDDIPASYVGPFDVYAYIYNPQTLKWDGGQQVESNENRGDTNEKIDLHASNWSTALSNGDLQSPYMWMFMLKDDNGNYVMGNPDAGGGPPNGELRRNRMRHRWNEDKFISGWGLQGYVETDQDYRAHEMDGEIYSDGTFTAYGTRNEGIRKLQVYDRNNDTDYGRRWQSYLNGKKETEHSIDADYRTDQDYDQTLGEVFADKTWAFTIPTKQSGGQWIINVNGPPTTDVQNGLEVQYDLGLTETAPPYEGDYEGYPDLELIMKLYGDIVYREPARSIGKDHTFEYQGLSSDRGPLVLAMRDKTTLNELAQVSGDGATTRSFNLDPSDSEYDTRFSDRVYSYDAALALLVATGADRFWSDFQDHETVAHRRARALLNMQNDATSQYTFGETGHLGNDLAHGAVCWFTDHYRPVNWNEYYGDMVFRTASSGWHAYALLKYLDHFSGSPLASRIEQSVSLTADYFRNYRYDDSTAPFFKAPKFGLNVWGGPPNYSFTETKLTDVGWEATLEVWWSMNKAYEMYGDAKYATVRDRAEQVLLDDGSFWYNDGVDDPGSGANSGYDANGFIIGLGSHSNGNWPTNRKLKRAGDFWWWGRVWLDSIGAQAKVNTMAPTLKYWRASSTTEATGEEITGYMPHASWGGYDGAVEGVWYEGSYGQLLCHHRLGEVEEYNNLLADLGKGQLESGGFKYAEFTDDTYGISQYPSVASTAWAIFAADADFRNWFWGESKA